VNDLGNRCSLASQLRGYKKFLNLFGAHPEHHHDDAAFRMWLEMMWTFMDATYDRPAFDAMEAKTSKPVTEWWGKVLGAYVEVAEEAEWMDVLGPVYEELTGGRARARSGQYFTPWPLCRMMAEMQLGSDVTEFKAKADRGERLRICDPCVGSGAMLLAFAAAVRDHAELGYGYIDCLEFYGQDIDNTCVLMTKIQLRINGLDGFGRAARLASSITPALARILLAVEQLAQDTPPPPKAEKFIQFGLLRRKTKKEAPHVSTPHREAGSTPAVPTGNRAARRRDRRAEKTRGTGERAARRRARRTPTDA